MRHKAGIVLSESVSFCGFGNRAATNRLNRMCYHTQMNLKPVLQAILEHYVLPLGGDHGVAHWARVLENGL